MRELHHPTCTCDCHKVGTQILHCVPCCSLCGYKFIDKDGKVDLIDYNNALRLQYSRKVPYIDGGEYFVKNKYNHDSTKVKDKRK